jgi:hypothetical protein
MRELCKGRPIVSTTGRARLYSFPFFFIGFVTSSRLLITTDHGQNKNKGNRRGDAVDRQDIHHLAQRNEGGKYLRSREWLERRDRQPGLSPKNETNGPAQSLVSIIARFFPVASSIIREYWPHACAVPTFIKLPTCPTLWLLFSFPTFPYTDKIKQKKVERNFVSL